MDSIKLKAENLNLFFGNKQILKNVNIDFPKNQVTSLIASQF
jgi:phosphate transport system ATP-binding protein